MDDKPSLDDRIAIGFRKAVTRRTMLQRCMRWTLVAGTAMAVNLKWPSSAYASNCSAYGVQGDSCYCAPTQSCPGSICGPNRNVAAYHKRCDAWTAPNSIGQYCWCSKTCWSGSPARKGYYRCCDGYVQNGSGCNRNATRCICLDWQPV